MQDADSSAAADPTDPPLHVATVWEVVKRQIRRRPEGVTEDLMQDMNVLFERHLGPAIEILDKGWVHKLRTSCGRELTVVKGKAQSQYVIVGESCPCQFFASSVTTGEALWCKHLIAVQLRDCQQPPLRPTIISSAEYFKYVVGGREHTAVSPQRRQRKTG